MRANRTESAVLMSFATFMMRLLCPGVRALYGLHGMIARMTRLNKTHGRTMCIRSVSMRLPLVQLQLCPVDEFFRDLDSLVDLPQTLEPAPLVLPEKFVYVGL